MILADTSIWIDHLRKGDANLARRLQEREICMHPYIVVELALGDLRARAEVLDQYEKLPRVPMVSYRELMTTIETHRLYSRGFGFVDANLIASVLVSPRTLLWTRDRKLRVAAESLGIHADLA